MKKKQEKPQRSKYLYYIFPYFLSLILFGLLIFEQTIKQDFVINELPESLKKFNASSYPQLNLKYDPFFQASSGIIMDDSSRAVLFEKNSKLRFSTASTAKIMSALVAMDYFQANDELEVPDMIFEGTVVGFSPYEKIYFDDVLYSMMLASGNDAAYTIAANYEGGLENFVKKMNEKAKEFGLKDTSFADPAGLNDDGNYTTAYDLARLCSIALKNKTLSRVVSTRGRVFSNVLSNKIYEIENLNKLLGTNGINGIKTGQTIGAGGVLTISKIEDGRRFIVVVMQSPDRFGDSLSLVNLVNKNIILFTPDKI